VANAFVRLAREKGKRLTNMQVQKLVFFAQAYTLALLDRCLYERHIHAWQWGPVVPRLYKSLQSYGSGQVTEEIASDDSVEDASEEYGVIKGVWDGYGKYTGSQLSEITHRDGSPWDKTWKREPFGVISVEEIKAYYKKLASQN
jgi:uncharacterized phage-associated protein